MKTILVLTAIERAFYSATIEYQLIDPVIKVARKRKDVRFVFLCLVPFTFYFVRGEKRSSFSRFRKRRREISEKLRKKDIRVIFFPVLYPFRHRSFYLKWFEIPIFLFVNLPVLLIFRLFLRPALIHARGYPASLLAYYLKSLRRIGFIFDMRDVYTLKGIEAGVFGQDGGSYRTWNALEQNMLRGADAVIVTSEPFKSYTEHITGSSKRIRLVPNSVNKNRFFRDKDIRGIVRKGLNIDGRFVLLHSGTFSTEGDIALAVGYFKKWKRNKEESFFLILTPNRRNAEKISAISAENDVASEDFRILTPEPEEVPDMLRAGDVGLHLESKAMATEYCIAIKDGEYLATGLPVICTPYLKGIAPLIEQYDCGLVIDPEQETSFEKEKQFLKHYKTIQKNTERIVDEVLSLDIAVEALAQCYASLLDAH